MVPDPFTQWCTGPLLSNCFNRSSHWIKRGTCCLEYNPPSVEVNRFLTCQADPQVRQMTGMLEVLVTVNS